MSRRTGIVITCTACLLAACAITWLNRGQWAGAPGSPDGAPRSSADAVSGSARTEAQHDVGDGRNAVRDHFPGVRRNRDGLPLEDDLFKPVSRAEQRWLDRNGYFASIDQHMAYVTADAATLAATARDGDRLARLEETARALRSGDARAESGLRDLAADGVSNAASVLGDHYTVGSQRDPQRAYAYKRVAELLGDVRMGIIREFNAPPPSDGIQRMEAEVLALDLYRDILERRRRRHGPAAQPSDPRPILPD